MIYNINIFAAEFKKTIIWMLNSDHSQKIINDLNYFKKNKEILNEEPDSIVALRTIIELIKTNGYRLKLASDFNSNWDSFIKKYKKNFRELPAKEELILIVGAQNGNKINQIFAYNTLKEFTDKLYELAKERKTIVLGEKGRDNYLRDFGFWDRIPMDRHEMRFIIRSGIFNSCSSDGKYDPLERSDLHDALKNFCIKYLKDFTIEGIDLGSAPGIADIFIWSFSAEDRYNICVAVPKCNQCNLNSVCLYALCKNK